MRQDFYSHIITLRVQKDLRRDIRTKTSTTKGSVRQHMTAPQKTLSDLRLRLGRSETHSRMLGCFVSQARILGYLNSQARTLNLRLSSDARTLGDSDCWMLVCSETRTVELSSLDTRAEAQTRTLGNSLSDTRILELSGSDAQPQAQLRGSDARRLTLGCSEALFLMLGDSET